MFSAWIPPNYIFRARSVKSPQRITHDSVWGTLGTLPCTSALTAICCCRKGFYMANRHGLNPSFGFQLNIDTK